MPDREKVIKGLECHLKELSVGKTCYECPYIGDNPCEIQLIANALELLKEQEPRVLTLEDVQIDCPDYVYVETKGGWIRCTVMDCVESNKDAGCFVYGIDEYFVLTWKDYCAKWRCWTGMPTDEQRKAVKWDD